MFTSFIQVLDLLHYHEVGLFLVFFVLSWGFYIAKLTNSRGYSKEYTAFLSDVRVNTDLFDVSVIIPVVGEPLEIWEQVLNHLKEALKDIPTHRVIVVANGGNGVKNADMAKGMGFDVISVMEAGKRNAIKLGVDHIYPLVDQSRSHKVTFILDSDTIVDKNSLVTMLKDFQVHESLGGVTPRHLVFNRDATLARRISDWMEDIRFNEVLPGQSKEGAVSCLPGRALGIQTELLKQAVPALVSQTFLGKKCISGDDRFLTSWLLQRDYLCVYNPTAVVHTDAPSTIKGFAKQRLRWSRTSLRETIRSLPWALKYPYMTFTVVGNVLLRWLFLAVIINFILFLSGITTQNHYLQLSTFALVVGTILGFLASGFLRQLRHLINYPQDLPYLVPFLFVTTFILTPIEWFGNFTLKESGWMTRDLHGGEHGQQAAAR